MFEFLKSKQNAASSVITADPSASAVAAGYNAYTPGAFAPAAPLKPPKQLPPFGEKVGNLIRFGGTWLNLNEVSVIEFDPPDGCGAEVRFNHASKVWHIPNADGRALRAYLEGFDAVRKSVDESED
jgi:hypothetical protein